MGVTFYWRKTIKQYIFSMPAGKCCEEKLCRIKRIGEGGSAILNRIVREDSDNGNFERRPVGGAGARGNTSMKSFLLLSACEFSLEKGPGWVASVHGEDGRRVRRLELYLIYRQIISLLSLNSLSCRLEY